MESVVNILPNNYFPLQSLTVTGVDPRTHVLEPVTPVIHVEQELRAEVK